MDWDEYFRQQATMYRQLAQKTEELLDLAAVCEEVANNIEDLRIRGYTLLQAIRRGTNFRRTTVPGLLRGVVGPDKAPPYNFSRDAIEEAIDVEGFQLWRFGKKMEAQT
jgi:hypothetical protein